MMALVPEPLASLFVLALGLVVGSFLNVCIHRLPRGESIVRPGSHCPACGRPIPWYRNVPLVSWVALRGRCADCRARIPLRYPFVEALGGALVLAFWLGYGWSVAFPIAAAFALAMVVLFFTDLDSQLLPDVVTLPGVAVGIAVAWVNPFLGRAGWRAVALAVSGAALGAGILWGIGALYSRLRNVDAMGLGDVKMMAMVGAFGGPLAVLFTLLVASIAGAAVGLALIPLKGKSLRDTLPFGCFLAPAALAALVFGPRAFAAYLDLLAPLR